MSDVLGILGGIVAGVVGIILLIVWWSPFLIVLRGVIPPLLLLAGAGILVFFASEIKSKRAIEKAKAAPSSEEKKAG